MEELQDIKTPLDTMTAHMHPRKRNLVWLIVVIVIVALGAVLYVWGTRKAEENRAESAVQDRLDRLAVSFELR